MVQLQKNAVARRIALATDAARPWPSTRRFEPLSGRCSVAASRESYMGRQAVIAIRIIAMMIAILFLPPNLAAYAHRGPLMSFLLQPYRWSSSGGGSSPMLAVLQDCPIVYPAVYPGAFFPIQLGREISINHCAAGTNEICRRILSALPPKADIERVGRNVR
jgi:hypothetical protein